MNTQVSVSSAPVPDAKGASRWRFSQTWWLGILSILSMQCDSFFVQINGGASELYWTLRTFAGESIGNCEEASIEKIRLCWLSADSDAKDCDPSQSQEFRCNKLTGVTLFDIPVGRTRFFVEPICQDGLPAKKGTYQSPPEILRTVREGEVVTLDSQLIVVTKTSDSCGAECTCVRE